MMRPSDAHLQAEAAVEECKGEDAPSGASREAQPEDLRVWRGDSGDWDRLRNMLKNIARDGPKLELWADWLSDLIGVDTITLPHSKIWMSGYPTSELGPEAATDATPRLRERPPREWIFTVLREHVCSLMLVPTIDLISLYRERNFAIISSIPTLEPSCVASSLERVLYKTSLSVHKPLGHTVFQLHLLRRKTLATCPTHSSALGTFGVAPAGLTWPLLDV